jgi:hypothetical protein
MCTNIVWFQRGVDRWTAILCNLQITGKKQEKKVETFLKVLTKKDSS